MRKSVETALSSATYLIIIFIGLAIIRETYLRRQDRKISADINNVLYPNWGQADQIVGDSLRYSKAWISIAERRRNVLLTKTPNNNWTIAEDQTMRDTIIGDTIYIRLRD